MPNWCTNVLTLRHNDRSMIKKAIDACNENSLFNAFAPVKDGQDRTNIWGTKWEISEATVTIQENNMFKVYFMTAWSPPIQFYGKMNELGFDVYALWNEPGMGSLGIYNNGEIMDFPYPVKPEDFEGLPQEFEDEFQIESDFYEYQIEDYAESL